MKGLSCANRTFLAPTKCGSGVRGDGPAWLTVDGPKWLDGIGSVAGLSGPPPTAGSVASRAAPSTGRSANARPCPPGAHAPPRSRAAAARGAPVVDFLFTYYSPRPGTARAVAPGPRRAAARRGGVPRGPGARPRERRRRPADPAALPDRHRSTAGVRPRPCSPPPRPARPGWAASGCTSGRWCTAATARVTPVSRCGWVPPRPTRSSRRWPSLHPPRRVPVLHRRRAPSQRGAAHARPTRSPRSNRGACTRPWTFTSGPTS